jgi:hypothetical protein
MIEEWIHELRQNFFVDMEAPQELLAKGLEKLRAMGYAIPEPDSLLHHWQPLPEGPADLANDAPWPRGGFKAMIAEQRAVGKEGLRG